jgi:transposase
MVMTTSAVLVARAHDGVVGDEKLGERPRRRRFIAEYKLAILDEYDRVTEAGAKGAILRREGLYSSHIVEWRRARGVGALEALRPKGRSPKRSAAQVELDALRRKHARVTNELERTKLALEIVGKAHALLETLSESADTDESSTP